MPSTTRGTVDTDDDGEMIASTGVVAGAAGRIGNDTRTPPANHSGNTNIVATTADQAACRTDAALMRSAHSTPAVPAAMSDVRIANSRRIVVMTSLLCAARARNSRDGRAHPC